MDKAQELVRSVMRSFHGTNEILVIEALVTHGALRDDDLAYLLGFRNNTKDLHRLCGPLREIGMLTVYNRAELAEGKTRATSRMWYFIDYRRAVDAIKWRVHRIDKDMQRTGRTAEEVKEFVCLRAGCGAQWALSEVLDSASPQGFRCHRCNDVLEPTRENEAPGHRELSQMNAQFKFMTDLLQRIDQEVMPECTFDKAFEARRLVDRPEHDRGAESVAVDMAVSRPTAVKGMSNTGPRTIAVTISTAADDQENIDTRKRKERLLKENALPSWMLASSVPLKASFDLAQDRDEGSSAKRVKVEITDTSRPASFVNDPEQDDDDEEDDLEFEDVV